MKRSPGILKRINLPTLIIVAGLGYLFYRMYSIIRALIIERAAVRAAMNAMQAANKAAKSTTPDKLKAKEMVEAGARAYDATATLAVPSYAAFKDIFKFIFIP